MDALPIITAPVKRPRGRPPKVKRPVPNPIAPPVSEDAGKTPTVDSASVLPDASTKIGQTDSGATRGSHAVAPNTTAAPIPVKRPRGRPPKVRPPPGTPAPPATASKRARDEDDAFVPSKRIRDELSVSNPNLVPDSAVPESLASALSSTAERKGKATAIPARRSTRHATVQSTQISEGTLRPPGPPCLEAALSIALRNLESETWYYLWSYYKKHPGGPLPTPAQVKAACPRVRHAAEVVDRADRELEEAIDEIIRASKKKRRRRGPRPGKQVEKSLDTTSVAKDSLGADAEDEELSSMSEEEESDGDSNAPGNRDAANPATRVSSTTTSDASDTEMSEEKGATAVEPKLVSRARIRLRVVRRSALPALESPADPK